MIEELADRMNRLIDLADAYDNALENDYCDIPGSKHNGMRPDEIAGAIIREIRR